MERLPGFALDEILSYLDPHSVNFTVPLAFRGLQQFLVSDKGYVRYFAGLTNLPKEISIAYSQYREAVLQLFSPTRAASDVPIIGFSTTGGVDRDIMHYWVGNLFTRGTPPYCTDESQDNVVCAGVLAAFTRTEEDPELAAARKEAAGWVRKNRFLRNIAAQVLKPPESQEPLTPLEENLFVEMYTHNVDAFFFNYKGTPEARARHSERLQELHRTLSQAQREMVTSLQVDPRRRNLLEAKIVEKERLEQTDMFFCANRVTVSRKGQFTCPLETFIVFVSASFVPVTSEEFAKYDNLLRAEDVDDLVHHGLPSSAPLQYEGALLREFRRSKGDLQPILWGKFTARGAETIDVRLSSVCSGKFLYVKLINAENRMREMGDPHSNPNIDVDCVIAQGAMVSLELL